MKIRIRQMVILLSQDAYLNKYSYFWNLFMCLLTFFCVGFFTKDGVGETFESTKCYCLSFGLCALLLAFIPAVGLWKSEHSFVKNEIENKEYTVWDYVSAKVILYMILTVLQGLIGAFLFVIFLDGHGANESLICNFVFEIFGTMTLLSLAGASMGLLVSLVVKRRSFQLSLLIVAIIIMAQLVLSNSIFELPDEFAAISYFIIMRWGIQALCTSMDINNLPLKLRVIYPMIDQPVIEMFDFVKENIQQAWLSLLAFIVVFILLFYFILKKDVEVIMR